MVRVSLLMSLGYLVRRELMKLISCGTLKWNMRMSISSGSFAIGTRELQCAPSARASAMSVSHSALTLRGTEEEMTIFCASTWLSRVYVRSRIRRMRIEFVQSPGVVLSAESDRSQTNKGAQPHGSKTITCCARRASLIRHNDFRHLSAIHHVRRRFRFR